MHSKCDLDGFMKRMVQQKAQVFTQKAVNPTKVFLNQHTNNEDKKGSWLETSLPADEGSLPATKGQDNNAVLATEESFDIEAQVEAAKLLVQSIQMRNQADEQYHTGNGASQKDEAMRKTGDQSIFNQGGPGNATDRPIDKTLGKSPAFKAVSRSELNKIKGDRPMYE